MTAEQGMSRKKGIVAMGRRLGELLYTLMKKGNVYEVRKNRGVKAHMRLLRRIYLRTTRIFSWIIMRLGRKKLR
jgi:hypothetical protein